MKVAIFANGLPHYYTKQLELMQKKGVDLVVIVPASRSQAIGKNVYEVDCQFNFKVIRTKEYLTWYKKPFFKHFFSIIKSEKPDIVIVGWPYWMGIVLNPMLLFWLIRTSTKLVFKEIPFQIAPFNQPIRYYYDYPIYNEDEVYENPHKINNKLRYTLLALLRKYAYRCMDAVLVYRHDVFELYSSYGVSFNKIFVTYNSPDTNDIFSIKADLEKLEISVVPYSLIHVGRLVRWKRVHLLIDVFAELVKKYPQAKLYIIGDGPEKNNLINQAKSLGVLGQIEFCGGIYNYFELGKKFLEAQIYVLAGMGGLSINEAMAFGKPIVCSICDGTEKFLVRDGVNGLYFKDNDKNDLYQKIDYLFSNPDVIHRMGRESERIIREEVNINKVVDRYIYAFQQIVKNRELV